MKESYPLEVEGHLRADPWEIVVRYLVACPALMPMLHLVQSADSFVSSRGITLCADTLGLTCTKVPAVAAFYGQYRHHPNGEYNVGVCTNALCVVTGRDEIWEALTPVLGVGSDETTPDDKITLEALECNAGCDYAPIVMVNWELSDNQAPTSALQIVEDTRVGRDLHPTRGVDKMHTFKETERVLTGLEGGHVDGGPGTDYASFRGLEIARERDWNTPKEVAK